MQSSEALPLPAEWPDGHKTRYTIALAVNAVLFVLAPLAIALVLLSRDNARAAFYSVAAAVLGSLICWVGYETRLRRRTRTDPIVLHESGDGSRSLEVPYSSRLFLGYAALTGAFAAVFTVAAFHAAASPDHTNGAIVWAAVAVLFASLPALMLTGRFALGRIRLSPEGLYQRGWTFESFIPWSGINGVFPRHTDSPIVVVVGDENAPWQRRQITRLWRQDRLPKVRSGQREVPMIVIPGKFLSVDPVLLYHLLGYYLENPGARAELGTEAGLRRARAAAFAG
ncbi:hypothetical protein FHX69_5275 [Prauserella muralis]|nr:hypothetical protein FHX69_5275 [Prauserella muralis]